MLGSCFSSCLGRVTAALGKEWEGKVAADLTACDYSCTSEVKIMGENCTNLGLQCGLARNECRQDTVWDDTCHIVEHERRVRHHIGSKGQHGNIEIPPTVRAEFRACNK